MSSSFIACIEKHISQVNELLRSMIEHERKMMHKLYSTGVSKSQIAITDAYAQSSHTRGYDYELKFSHLTHNCNLTARHVQLLEQERSRHTHAHAHAHPHHSQPLAQGTLDQRERDCSLGVVAARFPIRELTHSPARAIAAVRPSRPPCARSPSRTARGAAPRRGHGSSRGPSRTGAAR